MIKVMKSKQVENKNISCSNMLHVANIIDDTRVQCTLCVKMNKKTTNRVMDTHFQILR